MEVMMFFSSVNYAAHTWMGGFTRDQASLEGDILCVLETNLVTLGIVPRNDSPCRLARLLIVPTFVSDCVLACVRF